MGTRRGRTALWCAGVLVLASCTGSDPAAPPDDSSTPTAAADSSPSASGAPGAPTPSPTDSTAASPGVPEAGSAAAPSATASSPRTASPPAPRQTGPAPPAPAQPDQPSGIPAPASDPAAQFRDCSDTYIAITATLTVSASVTPVVIEGWAEAYQAASARAAEGDYAAAAQQCSQVVDAIERATG